MATDISGAQMELSDPLAILQRCHSALSSGASAVDPYHPQVGILACDHGRQVAVLCVDADGGVVILVPLLGRRWWRSMPPTRRTDATPLHRQGRRFASRSQNGRHIVKGVVARDGVAPRTQADHNDNLALLRGEFLRSLLFSMLRLIVISLQSMDSWKG
jgi:hypothetical protein